MPNKYLSESAIELISKLIKKINRELKISAFIPIYQGANSRVVLIKCVPRKYFILKIYYDRKRFINEFNSCKFLYRYNIRNIPQPLAKDTKNQLAVYTYISGSQIKTNRLKSSDIDQAIDFIAKLNKLKKLKTASKLPLAAEACLSLDKISENIDYRIHMLLSQSQIDPETVKMKQFLTDKFVPLYKKVISNSKNILVKNNINHQKLLLRKYLTLSPSDFGYHNARRNNDGKLFFFDFEYFGWDDPVKLISDFLLHPKMDLKYNIKQYFVKKALNIYKDDHKLVIRLKAFYPLYGLKWSLIMLNEFLPEIFQRRQFAGTRRLNRSKTLREQLLKTQKMYSYVEDHYQIFPYKV